MTNPPPSDPIPPREVVAQMRLPIDVGRFGRLVPILEAEYGRQLFATQEGPFMVFWRPVKNGG